MATVFQHLAVFTLCCGQYKFLLALVMKPTTEEELKENIKYERKKKLVRKLQCGNLFISSHDLILIFQWEAENYMHKSTNKNLRIHLCTYFDKSLCLSVVIRCLRICLLLI